MTKLSCKSCGNKFEISDDIDQFACNSCGTEWLVKREGGIAYLISLKLSESNKVKGKDNIDLKVKPENIQNPVKKPNNKLQNIFVGTIIVIAFCVYGIILIVSPPKSTKQIKSKPSPIVNNEPVEEKKVIVKLKKVKYYIRDEFGVTQKYAICDIVVTNKGYDSVDVSAIDFVLEINNVEYISQTVIDAGADIGIARLKNNGEISGKIAFKWPEGNNNEVTGFSWRPLTFSDYNIEYITK